MQLRRDGRPSVHTVSPNTARTKPLGRIARPAYSDREHKRDNATEETLICR